MPKEIMMYPATITAVLGATNTGKTHYAVERMCARTTGIIGLPLRLLAREVYDKVCAIKGEAACALITGEEKIIPPHARFFICTVEAMPMDAIMRGDFASVIIDEVQMIDHRERGHVFTDRVLHARGTEETLLLGALNARDLIYKLVPSVKFINRERFSTLSYSGHTKLSRLPKRTVIVAFSAPEVYALAEYMRRTYGGAALVMGGLSPRTRNAQAELYQSGEVDYMVATDAIGMGLNLDVDHVAFADMRKFDGQRRRYLYASEIAQIAGRAGRFRTDGSFGTTGRCLPIDDDVIAQIENHYFEPLRAAEWRETDLNLVSLEALHHSLANAPPHRSLRRIAPAADELALMRLSSQSETAALVDTPAATALFWAVCQIPDFRNLGAEAHARLLEDIFTHMADNNGKLSDAYIEAHTSRLNHTEGNIEILASRLACMRTWTYISNKRAWITGGITSKDRWIDQTRAIEYRLSDALHHKLVARFIDRRTSALLKGIGANTQMEAEITSSGEVLAEGHTLGHLNGLVFTASETHGDLDAKAVNAAAALALAPEIDRRLMQITGSEQGALTLDTEGNILWGTAIIGKIRAAQTLLKPEIIMIGGELGSAVYRDQAATRVQDFINTEIEQKFATLLSLKPFCDDPATYQGARGLAHVLYENYGMIPRLEHLQLVKDTDPTARGYLRKMTVQIGYHHVFLRDMLKPAAARLLSTLFAFAWDKDGGGHKTPFLPTNGMASTPDDAKYSEAALNVAGYTRVGPRIIRFDMLARLSQMLMQAGNASTHKHFRIAQEMMALLGCGFDDMEKILDRLGYQKSSHALTDDEQAEEKRALSEFLVILQDQEVRANEVAVSDTIITHPTDAEAKAAKATEGEVTAPVQTPIVEPTTDEAKASVEAVVTTPVEATSSEPLVAEPLAANAEKTDVVKAPAPKRAKPHWEKPLTVYRPRPEQDESGAPIVPTHFDVWKRNFKKPNYKARSFAARHDENAAPNSDSGDQGSAPRKPRNQKMGEFAKGMGSAQSQKSARKPNKNTKRPPQKQRSSGAKSKNWSAPSNPEDSPFAALAALQTSSKPKK